MKNLYLLIILALSITAAYFLVEKDEQREVFEIYQKLNRSNQHKMKPIPICTVPKDLKE